MTAPLPENLPSPPPETPQYRPALHFTPAAHWMNDPNGLVFHQGVYHLFFQYYPEGLSWGPMHWGHASSTDLLRWEEHPIALYPDPLGLIFSGSVVWDERNLSGLAPAGSAPLVAIFTHHDSAAARAGAISWETQSLAWSVDNGMTWTKYAGNPVLKNPGLRDFRDPKVFWLAETGRWVMSLSTGTQIAFYSSADLKDWQLTSEFGADAGSHGGTWECPDLFSLPLNGRQRWVLLVSLTSGGPNGGSATQYFIGDFDGQRFTPEHHDVRWLDLGCDNYAGVTWSGTGERRVFIGWMGNWDYAKVVPTAPWRSAMTLPRELSLREVSGQTRLASRPAREAEGLGVPAQVVTLSPSGSQDLSAHWLAAQGKLALHFEVDRALSWSLNLSNDAGDHLVIGFDAAANHYLIDRRDAGLSAFHPPFARRQTGARPSTDAARGAVALVLDATSVELFAEDGVVTMTSLFFPRAPWQRATLNWHAPTALSQLRVHAWPDQG